MRKERNDKKWDGKFSNKKLDILEIEKKIDKLIVKKEAVKTKTDCNEIDFKKISLESQNRKKVYYVKRKKNLAFTKDKKLSEEIISDARYNLGEEPIKNSKLNTDFPVTNLNPLMPKKRIKFGKNKNEKTNEITQTKKSKFELKLGSKKKEKQEKIALFENTPSKKLNPLIEMKSSRTKEEFNQRGNQEIPQNENQPVQGEFKNPNISPEKEKSGFHVENLPGKNFEINEAKLVDKKIQNTNIENIKEKEKNIGEFKALQLAKEHIKEIPADQLKGEKILNNKKETQNFADLSIEGEAKQEHVFFDEEEENDGSYEWTPRVPEKDKKDLPPPLATIPPQIDTDYMNDIGGEIELPKEVLRSKSVKLTDLGFSENEWEELDFYPLHEPFVYVEVLREKESLDKCYFLVEVELTEEEEEIMEFITETMNRIVIDTEDLESKGDENYLSERLNQVIKEYDVKIKEESVDKIFYYIGKNSLGLGRIDPLLKDSNIEDISCDGSNVPLFLYHRKYGSLKSNVKFVSEDELSSFIFKLAQKCGKHISIAEPMLDATMPDGSRVQMTLSDEITTKGSTFTIRKFREDPFSPPDLVEFNTMSPEMVAYLWIAIENGVNTLFAGGTASGKTTAMNAIALFIPRESKIVSIEETREINLPHPNWIPGVARAGFGEVVSDKMVGEIDMYDLMKAALRQRPEYILVGEIRGREAYVLFQAMATGHATYSTVHADSAQSLIHRLEGKPINIPRVMLQSLDIVCLHVITRVKNKRARRCKQIIEIIDIDPTTKEILTNEVFRWDPVEDRFVYSGKSYILERVRAEKDLNREAMTIEIKNRKSIVEWMNDNNVREFREVSRIIARYSDDAEETMITLFKEE